MILSAHARARAAKLAATAPAPTTKNYTVLSAFAYNHVMQAVGATLKLTDAQAKYHVLARRIALTAAKGIAPAAPIEIAAAVADPEAPVASVASVADEPHAD